MSPQTVLPHPSPAGIMFHRLFQKDWKKLQYDSFRAKFRNEILPRFQHDPFHSELRNHEVGKKRPGCRSIDVTGNIRALYMMQEDTVVFVRIGSHSHLYG